MLHEKIGGVTGFSAVIFVALVMVGAVFAQKRIQTPAKKLPLLVFNFQTADSRADVSTTNATIFQSFVERLKKNDKFEYTIRTELTKGEEADRALVIEQALAEQEKYVVWIQLELNDLTVSRRPSTQIDKTYVNYIVYAPKTAQVVTQGRVEQEALSELRRSPDTRDAKTIYDTPGRPTRSGPNIFSGTSGSSFPSFRTLDIDALRRAGRETARRVFQALEKI